MLSVVVSTRLGSAINLNPRTTLLSLRYIKSGYIQVDMIKPQLQETSCPKAPFASGVHPAPPSGAPTPKDGNKRSWAAKLHLQLFEMLSPRLDGRLLEKEPAFLPLAPPGARALAGPAYPLAAIVHHQPKPTVDPLPRIQRPRESPTLSKLLKVPPELKR